MKEYKIVDLEVKYAEPVIIDYPIESILGGSIADLLYEANTKFIIIATPWEMTHSYCDTYDCDIPHTWLLSDFFDNIKLYQISFDGWEYKEGVDYSERDYFRITGYTANKDLLEELESIMYCRYEFDLSYNMYNYDENYNII